MTTIILSPILLLVMITATLLICINYLVLNPKRLTATATHWAVGA